MIPNERNTWSHRLLSLGCFLFLTAIASGAFGAHALKELLSEKLLSTFQTGVNYHFYIALSCFLQLLVFNTKQHKFFAQINILSFLLFSGGCYAYALTEIKFFAMAVPIGGLSFLLSWGHASYLCVRKNFR